VPALEPEGFPRLDDWLLFLGDLALWGECSAARLARMNAGLAERQRIIAGQSNP
jgi:hypothetical protein